MVGKVGEAVIRLQCSAREYTYLNREQVNLLRTLVKRGGAYKVKNAWSFTSTCHVPMLRDRNKFTITTFNSYKFILK